VSDPIAEVNVNGIKAVVFRRREVYGQGVLVLSEGANMITASAANLVWDKGLTDHHL